MNTKLQVAPSITIDNHQQLGGDPAKAYYRHRSSFCSGSAMQPAMSIKYRRTFGDYIWNGPEFVCVCVRGLKQRSPISAP